MNKNDKINCDIAAERAVLSSLFRFGNEAYVSVSDLVNSNTFTHTSNQIIYKCAEHILKENKDSILDTPTILSSAHSLGLSKFFDSKEELNHLRAVMNFPIEKPNIEKLAAKIKKLEITRTIRETLSKSDKDLSEVTGDETMLSILGLAENPIFDLTASLNTTGSHGPQLIFSDYQVYLDRMDNPIEQIGLATGFPIFDRIIGGGLRRGTVSVVASRAKQGKSSHADNIALYNISNGIPILMLDTEMSADEHHPRMTACISGVPIKEIETGQCGKDAVKRKRAIEAFEILKDLPYHYLNICGQPFEETIAAMRHWIYSKVGFDSKGDTLPCLIIFDYIKMQSGESMKSTGMMETQLLGFITTGLVNFAQKYKVPIFTYAQLNRDGINKEDTDVIAASDRIAWFASNITILKRQSTDEIAAQQGQPEIFNTKMINLFARHGAGLDDGDYINYRFDRDICRLTEGPTKMNLGSLQSVAGQSSEIEVDLDGMHHEF